MLCGNQRERVCYPSGRHSRASCYCHWGRRGSYGVHPAVAAVSGTAWMRHWMRVAGTPAVAGFGLCAVVVANAGSKPVQACFRRLGREGSG